MVVYSGLIDLDTREGQRLFDALCDIHVYCLIDILWPKRVGKSKFKESVALLREAGITGWDEVAQVPVPLKEGDGCYWKEAYDSHVESYAISRFPAGSKADYDFYGAKCIVVPCGDGESRRVMSGDSGSCYMAFASYGALCGYVDELCRRYDL